MRRRAAWRILQLLLVFVGAAAFAVTAGNPAVASTNWTTAPALVAQAEPPPGEQPAAPDSGVSGELSPKPEDNLPAAKSDSTAAPPDSVSTAPPDSTTTAPPDSTSAAPADSSSTGATIKPNSALSDTLQFLPPPGSQTGIEPKAGGTPAAPKQRTGLLGIHPIAILFGLAVLNYFIIKAVTN
jgi:hypothetical protein